VDGKCPAFVCIPADIWDNRVDHRRAYEGDGGVRWEPSEPGFKHIRDIWQESYEREIRGRN